jgi:hypothetical protein
VDEHRRDRPTADVEARLDDRPGGLRAGIGLQLELGVCDEQHLLQQVVEVLALLRGHVGELGRPAPLLGLQTLAREVAPDTVGIGVRDVDLVDGHDDRHLCRARMRDRLARLWHDAVVGGNDEDRDVRHLRPAGPHRREGLVARSVEERDSAAVVLDLVRADVLRDSAGLGRYHARLADRVEQRGLAMVDVAHDRDDRRPLLERLLRVVEGLGLFVLLADVLDLDLTLELGRDQLDLVVRQ